MRVQVQLVTSFEEVIVTAKVFGMTTVEGVTFTVTVGAEQLLFGGADGTVPPHEPLHWILPVLVFVWPQAFGDEVSVQAAPYPEGFAGAEAEHVPLHWIVPLFVVPQAFAAEVQVDPYPEGFAGVEAEHEPLQVIVPLLVVPQAFAVEVQAVP